MINNFKNSYIYKRLEFNDNIIKEFDDLDKINECLVYMKKKDKTFYVIKDKIIFSKNLSTNDNKYGIVYFTKLKSFKFASKMMEINSNHKNEVKLSSYLSNIVIKNKNPHFLIIYKDLKCIYPPSYYLNKYKYPNILLNKYFILFSELAKGTLKDFLDIEDNVKDENLIMNTFFQIFFSILSFHHYTNYIHNDCHYNNFLYHKIKPGGYIHYKIYDKDIYIKNIGYLWVIWDFGLMKSLNNNNFIVDYRRILDVAFLNESFKYSDKLLKIFSIIKYKLLYNVSDEKMLWTYLLDFIFASKNKIDNKKIINLNKPYII